MGIISFSPLLGHAAGLSMLVARVQALAALLMPAQPALARTRSAVNQASVYRASALSYKTPERVAESVQVDIHAVNVQRLRIVRQFEPGTSRSCTGRLVISGRMSDVCAELERMAG